MFTITVNGKTHKVEKVTPRAIYEMGPALEMFAKIQKVTQQAAKGEETDSGPDDLKQAMNVLIDWFVIFCGNKFTRDDILDGYPADSIMTDIGVAIVSIQKQVTEAITAFPTTARQLKPTTPAPAETSPTATSRCRSMRTVWKRVFRRR